MFIFIEKETLLSQASRRETFNSKSIFNRYVSHTLQKLQIVILNNTSFVATWLRCIKPNCTQLFRGSVSTTVYAKS